MSMEDAVLRKITAFLIEAGPAVGEGGGFYLKCAERESERFEVLRPYPIDIKDKPDVLAKRIYLDAESEANGRGPGTHRFQIHASDAGGQKSALRRMSFRVYVDEDDIGANVHEEPTEKGLVSQLMRHLEAKERSFNASLSSMISGFQVTQTQLAQLLEQHQKAELERFLLTKSVVERNEEREQNIQRIHEREVTIRNAINRVFTIAPHVAAKFGLIPEGTAQKLLGSGAKAESDSGGLEDLAPLIPELLELFKDDAEAQEHIAALAPKLIEKLGGSA